MLRRLRIVCHRPARGSAAGLSFADVKVYDHDSGEEVVVRRVQVTIEPGGDIVAEIRLPVASIEMPEFALSSKSD